MQDVVLLAFDAGLPVDQLATAGAICTAESGRNTDAVGYNPPTYGCPDGSRDRGLWQINDCYHSEISDDCAFNALCNARAMVSISNGGTNWAPWSTYNAGAYLTYLGAAQVAVAAIFGGTGGIGCFLAPALLGLGVVFKWL